MAPPKLLDQVRAAARVHHYSRRTEEGYDIRTVQELLGHQDVRTTMIYTHALNRGGLAVRSPPDREPRASPSPAGDGIAPRGAALTNGDGGAILACGGPPSPPFRSANRREGAAMPDAEVLCVGEVLWDSLPAGLFLGGAPFNVACHLRALGVPTAMLSRVGADRLGAEALGRLEGHGLATDLVQVDEALPTGFVSVALDPEGNASYDIVKPAAWDAIETGEGLLRRAERAAAIVFGSLAQRHPVARATIERLCQVDVPRAFDVNLRPPYDDPEVVRRSLARADIVKLNEHELRRMSAWFGLPAGLSEGMRALAESFGCRTVCVTRGGDGAALLHQGRWTEHPGYPVAVRDTVGSGDAFLAALLSGLLAGHDDETILRHANLLGAYVATRFGATPCYEPEALARILAANEPTAAPHRGGR